jgi:hypothetical protein
MARAMCGGHERPARAIIVLDAGIGPEWQWLTRIGPTPWPMDVGDVQ